MRSDDGLVILGQSEIARIETCFRCQFNIVTKNT